MAARFGLALPATVRRRLSRAAPLAGGAISTPVDDDEAEAAPVLVLLMLLALSVAVGLLLLLLVAASAPVLLSLLLLTSVGALPPAVELLLCAGHDTQTHE